MDNNLEETKLILFEVKNIKVTINGVDFDFTLEELKYLKEQLNNLFEGNLVEKATEDYPVFPNPITYPYIQPYIAPNNPIIFPTVTWSYGNNTNIKNNC